MSGALWELRPGREGGIPLALVHGFLGRPAMWDETLAAIPDRGPAALACLPGHGPAPWRPGVDGLMAAAEELLAALPSSRPLLVGYSMGARVALAAACLRPEALRGLALIGAHPGLTEESDRAERSRWDHEQASRIRTDGLAAFAEAWAALPLFASQAAVPAGRLARQQQQRREHTVEGIAWAMTELGQGKMPPLGDRLAALSLPVLLLTGSLDGKFTGLAREMASRFPRYCRHQVIEGAGHNLALETPTKLAEILARFAASLSQEEKNP